MTTIHHAIVKAAAAKGFILSVVDDNDACAFHPASGMSVQLDGSDVEEPAALNELAKDAWAVCDQLVGLRSDDAFKALTFAQSDDLSGFIACPRGDEGNPVVEADTIDEFVDAVREYVASVEPDDADEDGDEPEHRSVVPERYKQHYREVGVAKQDNGDWMAAQMHPLVTVTDAELKRDVCDTDRVERIANRNGVDYDQNPGTRGWQGRYRMTVCNMLRRRVADTGKLLIPADMLGEGKPGQSVERIPPEAFVLKYRSRPRKRAAASVTTAEPKAKAPRKSRAKAPAEQPTA